MQKQLFFILLTGLLLAGCQSGFVDISQNLPVREITQISEGDYLDLAWLDNGTILVDRDYENYPGIDVLDINSNKLTTLQIDTSCRRPYVRSLQKLPNQRAGYILDCPNPKSQIIQEISLDTNKSSDLYTETSIIWLGDFSYSNDMKEIILVDINGLALESSLYHLDENGNRTNITSEFQRADFPAWSPTDNVVAFLGTKPYSGSDNPENWQQIENLFDYPWRLYLYHPETQEIEELPIEIVHPGRFKWSPDGKLIAFTGKYDGVSGVWLIDMQNDLDVIRVVNEIASFDFSPDSGSMAYFGRSDTEKQDTLYIVDLSTLNVNQ